MKNNTGKPVQYPVDAQSNLLLCAIASVLLAAENAGSKMQFYRGKTDAERRHHTLYQFLSTITGVNLLWNDPAPCDPYQTIYLPGTDSALLTDRLDLAMKAVGCKYERILKGTEKSAVFSQITASIDRGIPVLMKLGGGKDWHIVTGYDTDRSVLYGIDAHKHYSVQPVMLPDGYLEDGRFYLSGWYEPFQYGIIITDTYPARLPFPDLIRRMYRILSREENKVLEKEILSAIDTEPDQQKLVRQLNELTGYTLACRWHVAECCTSALYRMAAHPAQKGSLKEINVNYLQFHDLCWTVRAELGIGPAAAYELPDNVRGILWDDRQKKSLKDLFSRLFELDRNVCGLLRQILEPRPV